MQKNISLGLSKENNEFFSANGLKVTDYDFNLIINTFIVDRVLFPSDPDEKIKL
jgi:hypothetical protein